MAGRFPLVRATWSDLRRFGSGCLAILVAAAACNGLADDWPTYRHDITRSGVTAAKLSTPLVSQWTFRPQDAPQPAWGDPQPEPVEGILELRRNHFDDVFHTTIAGGRVYFGSSANGKVYCLDAATGKIVWTAVTGGPVRLVPTVAGTRVLVGSDDGYVWCLDAADGSVQWKFHAAPEDRRVLGHGKMTSLWPVRTGVLVDGDVAYFGAGIFPAEGVFLYACRVEDGKEIWRNDTCGESPQSRVSPQGYLLASSTTLYAPMGRVSPAAFDRRDGRLKQLTYFGKTVGGTYALLADEHVYTGTEEMVAYHGESRDRFAMFAGHQIVVTGQRIYMADGKELAALDRDRYPAASRKAFGLRTRVADVQTSLSTARRQKQPPETVASLEKQWGEVKAQLEQAEQELAATMPWKTACPCDESLILAGNTVLAGGKGQVMGVDASTGKVLWTGAVEGAAKGLAVAGGRLFASTDTGAIYAFGSQGSPQHGVVAEPATSNPYADSSLAPLFTAAAKTIRAAMESEPPAGNCLVLGCENGGLARELAQDTQWMIYVVEPDEKKAAVARRMLDAGGLLGSRVSVESWPLDAVPYSDYFANLVVSESALVSGQLPPAAEAARMLKPEGGRLVIGQPAELPAGVKRLETAALQQWVGEFPLEGGKMDGTWALLRRGALPGAGSWTHLYANAANTACGDDRLVEAPLGVLWFGYPGPGNMVNRHQRAAGPLSVGGRVFVQGQHVLMAYDIYNGLKLWEREVSGAYRPNASHDGGNLAANGRALFVAVGKQCLKLEPASGATAAEYTIPPAKGSANRWGWIACTDDLLLGSRTAKSIVSEAVFAVDPQTGKHLWVYEGKQISHNAIVLDGGRLYLVDGKVTADQRREAIDRQRQKIAQMPAAERTAAEKGLEAADVRLVVCLDAKTGAVQWRKPLDLTHCGGGNLAAMVHNGVLAIFGIYLDGHYWQQFFAGEFDSRKITALAAEDGRELWSRAVGYRVRPIIVGDTFHAEPWAFDLKTGEPQTRIHPITGNEDRWQFARPGHHCGCPSASPRCLFFRSMCLGYYDLEEDYGTMHFGAQRPGCWINFIPAGGLLVMPEASAGCMCPFPNMCTVVFQPASRQKGFGYYSAPGAATPVKRLAINLGAAGDRNDAEGNLWLGYPRPNGSLVLQLKFEVAMHPGGSFTARNSAYTRIAGTKDPWLYASAATGLRKCVVPLLDAGDGAARYRVRLFFADPHNSEPGRRVFDIKLQGKLVEENFDIAKSSGGKDRAAICEFDGIEVEDGLAVELLPKTGGKDPAQLPILQGIEVVRQEITRLGCSVPNFLLNDRDRQQAAALRLANLRDTGFAGRIEIIAPQGFQAVVGRKDVEVPSGKRLEMPLEVAVNPGVPAGNYQVAVRVLRNDGSLELERTVGIEHLGPRARMVVPVVEDAYVSHRYVDLNKGSAAVLLVDGGNEKLGDTDHNIALLKFQLNVPGRPLRARLRLHNAGNPAGNSGEVRLVEGPWREMEVNYANRPQPGKVLGQLGKVEENQVLECSLDVDLNGRRELSVLLNPTTCDGTDYLSRESANPPELIVEYEPAP